MAITRLNIPSSSHIAGATYDSDTLELVVEFQKNSYAYANVPAAIAEDFASAPSAGKFFDAQIKNKFATRKL